MSAPLFIEPVAAPTPPRGHYTVGTLRYDRKSMAILFGWLLWGDFAFTFFEQIFGRFMPLYLKDLNASNTFIGITTGSIAGLVNVIFLPNISQWSDRLRTRLGRRIPFLLVVTPWTVASLLGIGFAPEISQWLHQHVTAHVAPGLTGTALLYSLLCLFVVGFHFFNMVLVNSYNWLLRDVVPKEMMTWFLAWFRIVGTIAAVLFLWSVFPTMISHRRETFLAVSGFYLIAFLLMCWKVREGEYPEPLPSPEGSNFLTRFGSYFRDCLMLPIYRNFFIVYVMLVIAGSCAGSFLTLYTRDVLRLNMEEMGHIFAYSALFSAIVYVPMGWVCNRYSAMRVTLISLVFMLIGPLIAYFWVDSQTSWLIYSVAMAVPGVGWSLGLFALSMTLFPEKVFGQFSAGMNVFGCGGLIIGNYLIGLFMDATDSNYRMVFLWSAFFYAMALVPMIAVYRAWRKLGGPDGYVAPLPAHL